MRTAAMLLSWNGIYYIKVWLNEGKLSPGGNIVYALIGGDIRPMVDALQLRLTALQAIPSGMSLPTSAWYSAIFV